MSKFKKFLLIVTVHVLPLGVGALSGGCGGEEVHPQLRQGISPYDANKESFDAAKADYERALRKSGRGKSRR